MANSVIAKDDFVTPKVNKTIEAVKRTASTAFIDSPFVIPPSPLMKRLGCGSFVTVYKYKRIKTNGVSASPWAIKKAKKGHARRQIMNRLKDEANILRHLDHPNIVIFKKLTTTDKGDVCLSMEAFGKGLDDIIYSHQEDEEVFSAKNIMKVMWNIINALNYLHNTKKLLHGDIKSGNILIKGIFEQVKLCDFGVSIFLKDDLSEPKNVKDNYIGSEPWHAKEVVSGDGPITDKADIFPYGLLIWEMLALDVPHVQHMNADDTNEDLDGSFLSNEASFTVPGAYYKALGTRPPMPDYEYTEEYDPVIGTFVCCTIEDYKKRPSAEDIVKSLIHVVSEYDLGNQEEAKDEK